MGFPVVRSSLAPNAWPFFERACLRAIGGSVPPKVVLTRPAATGHATPVHRPSPHPGSRRRFFEALPSGPSKPAPAPARAPSAARNVTVGAA